MRVDRRFAARELDNVTGGRTLRPIVQDHLPHLVQRGLVDVARSVGIGKAHGAGQVTAVGEVEIADAGMAGMHVTQATLLRAFRGMRHTRVAESSIVAEGELLSPQKHLHVGPVKFFKIAMLGAGLLHKDLAIFLEHPCRDAPRLVALWTERFNDFWKALSGWRNRSTVVGCLGLLGRIGIVQRWPYRI